MLYVLYRSFQNFPEVYQLNQFCHQNEKVMLWDMIESELEDKIRRLEEDRNNVDVTSQVWAEQNLHRKRRRHRQVIIVAMAICIQ